MKKFDILQTNIKYIKSTNTWITVNKNFFIQGWKLEVYPEKKLNQLFSFKAHNDIIKSIIEVKVPKLK